MLSWIKSPIAAFVISGALFTVGCGDEGGNDTDSPFSPITGLDAGAPPPGPGTGIDAATTTGGPSTGQTQDTGVVMLVDASRPPPPPVTGLQGATDAGAPDASAATDGGDTQTVDGGGGAGSGTCCPDGKCLCHGPNPTALTANNGPYKTASYTVSGTGCVFYPTDAEPPFAAVAVSDGFTGSGGCGSIQTGRWGPLYASWGIVAMIVNTGSLDQPNQRGQALTKGIAAFKSENMKSGSPLFNKLAGRYGTSGFSMGGGGTSYASRDDKTLLSSVAIMPWGPVTSGVTTPTLVICGSSDGTAPCSSHGNPLYRGIANTVPKMRVQVSSGHAGQPSAGSGKSGQYGLAFQKVFLEGDTRWRPLLVAAPSEETNIK